VLPPRSASLLRKVDDRTLIFITHRLSPLRENDIVITMHEGMVSSVSTWHGDGMVSAEPTGLLAANARYCAAASTPDAKKQCTPC
jgi:energy-coupling factor transporter ATP-binding protein EcfA2